MLSSDTLDRWHATGVFLRITQAQKNVETVFCRRTNGERQECTVDPKLGYEAYHCHRVALNFTTDDGAKSKAVRTEIFIAENPQLFVGIPADVLKGGAA